MQEPTAVDASEIEEEVRDFANRFARLVVTRAFREGGASSDSTPRSGTNGNTPPDATRRGRNTSPFSTAEAELSLLGSQRLGAQLHEDADALRSRLLPSLRENAHQLHALYVAIDRVAEDVMPEIEETVKKMEKAVYDLEEMRKDQVDTRGPHGSFGLGLALGAGLWGSRTRENGVTIPEVFDTNKLFRVEEGGLAPL